MGDMRDMMANLLASPRAGTMNSAHRLTAMKRATGRILVEIGLKRGGRDHRALTRGQISDRVVIAPGGLAVTVAFWIAHLIGLFPFNKAVETRRCWGRWWPQCRRHGGGHLAVPFPAYPAAVVRRFYLGLFGRKALNTQTGWLNWSIARSMTLAKLCNPPNENGIAMYC